MPDPFPFWFPDLISSLCPSPAPVHSFLRYSSSQPATFWYFPKPDQIATPTNSIVAAGLSCLFFLSRPWTSRGPSFLPSCPLRLVSGICTCVPPWPPCPGPDQWPFPSPWLSWRLCRLCLQLMPALNHLLFAIQPHSLDLFCCCCFSYQRSIFDMSLFLSSLLMVMSSIPTSFTLASVQEPPKSRSLNLMSSSSPGTSLSSQSPRPHTLLCSEPHIPLRSTTPPGSFSFISAATQSQNHGLCLLP